MFCRTNRRETFSGKFRLANGDNRGIFNVRYERVPEYLLPDFLKFLNYNTTMTVLGTDYDNYAIIWTCRNINQYTHAESSWLMTRDQEPTEEVLQTAYGYLDKFGLRNYFVKSEQTKCDPWVQVSLFYLFFSTLNFHVETSITISDHLGAIKCSSRQMFCIKFL